MIAMDRFVKTVNYETPKFDFVVHIGKTFNETFRAYIIAANKISGETSNVGIVDADINTSIEELLERTKKELDNL